MVSVARPAKARCRVCALPGGDAGARAVERAVGRGESPRYIASRLKGLTRADVRWHMERCAKTKI
jgi:hypothetical protein